MEFVLKMLEVCFYVYVGFGVGMQARFFSSGRTVYFTPKDKKPIQLKSWRVTIYIVVMVFLWPIFFTKPFRKIFKVPGLW